MAQDGEPPKSVDKGKGKAVDGESGNSEEVKKDKDGKPLVNGKPEDGVIGGQAPTSDLQGLLLINYSATEELSEEDQQLKSELDMLVERLTVCSSAFVESLGVANLIQGVRCITLQISSGGDQRIDQDLDIFDDRRS